MPKITQRSDCPISNSLEIWGDKWSLLIIRDLMFAHKNTYSELLQSAEKISTNILAARLLALEENGIIEKLAHPDSKAKVWYQLTPKGIALMPLLLEISLWAEKFFEVPDSIAAVNEMARRDRAGVIREKSAELLAMNSVTAATSTPKIKDV